MTQKTLDGIPRPIAPRSRAGRKPLPEDQKPQSKLIGFYREDLEAVAGLIRAGYGKNLSAVVRRALRETWANERQSTAEEAGRLV